MNFEPFEPFEPADPLVPPAVIQPATSQSHYFDRTGWLWIVACVLFATTAGQLLSPPADPGCLRNPRTARAEVVTCANANPVDTTDGAARFSAAPTVPQRANQPVDRQSLVLTRLALP